MTRTVPALSSFVVLALAGSLLPAQAPDASASAPALTEVQDVREVSQVRIIRLSQVAEKVELDRNTGRGFEPSLMNLPIVQGNRLRTGRGWAEVEFEDNSTLRITPDTLVDFPTLGRTASGDTLNTLKLTRGTLYLSLTRSKASDFTLQVGAKTISVPPGSHIRVDVYPAGSEIYIIEGRVVVADASGSQVIGKARALKFDVPGISEPLIARDDTPGLYDEWDRTAVKYHSFAANSGAASAPYAYGSRDLTTYGQFADFGGGCGQMWTPYFSSASFDPFSNGVWAYYPGSGYSFVSAYPWGWLPFHSGNWASCGGRWGWQPAATWHGLNNHPITQPIRRPVGFRPLQPPSEKQPVGRPTLALAGVPHVTPSEVKGARFVFTKDSAGIGVPRDAFGNLGKISGEMDHKGFAERSVEPAPLFAAPVSTATHVSGGPHVASASPLPGRPVASSASPSGGSSNSSLWLASGGTAVTNSTRSNPPSASSVSSGRWFLGSFNGRRFSSIDPCQNAREPAWQAEIF